MKRKHFKKWWNRGFDWEQTFSRKTRKIFWGILFFLAVSLILTIDLLPSQIDLRVGQVSKTDISAPRTVTFIDEEKTGERREQAAESAPRVYEEDITANKTTMERLQALFSALGIKVRGGAPGEYDYLNRPLRQVYTQQGPLAGETEGPGGTVSDGMLISRIKQIYGEGLTDNTLSLLLNAPPEKRVELEKLGLGILEQKLEGRILPGDIERVQEELAQQVMELDLDKEYRLALANILEVLVRPNTILNEEATQRRKDEAVKNVEPVKTTVRQGESILRKGDVVTSEDIKILEELGLQKRRINYYNIFGLVMLSLIIIFLAGLYLYKYKKKLWEEHKKILLMELLVIIVLLLAKIASFFSLGFLAYLVPVAMASILATVLINTEIAVILTIFLSLLVALIFNNSFSVALVSFISGLVGVYSVSRVDTRNDLVRAGFYVSGVLIVLILALTLTGTFASWVDIIYPVLMGVLNGVFVAILANGLLPYLENAFDLTSSVKLLELSNPSQPLLKRLLVEAPGTYHHSVIVGNLAETAADNINADSLLARVGAYYHDIGKIKRPYFFSDNQFGGENPHDKLSANLSSLIIKSHVKDGVELAQEHKLPQTIINIIKQHHGTNLISFFYQQALKDSKHESVEEADFRYDGPKPHSKEAALIMLADITEAALRSKQFNRTNQNRVEGIVRELIREKLIEGQLDESDLTLKDFDTIVESFVKVLTGIYHQRVDYPENILKEMKRADKSDKNRDK